MGTTYTIQVIVPRGLNFSTQACLTGIDSVLESINRQLSTYKKNSEISLFNQQQTTDEMVISEDFRRVVEEAREISILTDGAFDITVMPLVELWGFHRHDWAQEWAPPQPGLIAETKKAVGYQFIRLEGSRLAKINPAIHLDVNAIAKGYGVDAVYNYLRTLGIADCMVEIGGEVRCSGENLEARPWLIGVDTPEWGSAPGDELKVIVELSRQAMATSGDYRNFIEYQGTVYSHTIDPRTGYPARSGVASATVMAPTCMEADALATALMVLTPADGIQLIESLPGAEAFVMIRQQTGDFELIQSEGFSKFIRH